MILKILFSYFSLSNLTALAQKIRNLLFAKFPDHPMVVALVANLDAAIATALQSVGSTTRQESTPEVRSADKTRDNSYRSLRDHVQAGLKRQNEAYRLACEALWPDFEKNGIQLYRLPGGEETTAIDSLLKDLSNPKKQEYLTTINAVEWVAEMDRDNKAFTEASTRRSANRSADETVDDKRAIKQLEVALQLACSTLESLQLMNGIEGAAAVVAEVNQYIAEANTSAKRSQSHAMSTTGSGE